MPWFPDFVGAVELARRQSRAAGQVDPVGQYVTALNKDDTRVLETAWPGHVVVYDPRAGEVRGHRQLRRFISQSKSWLAERRARIETVASTGAAGRAVVELLAHLDGGGQEVAWPVAVVAESPDDPERGVPHLLQPRGGRRTTPRQATHTRARGRPPR
jgi:SnoaL-like domain